MTSITDIQKENQDLIRLAVNCKFITANQEQKILSRLIEQYQKDSGYSVLKIFIEDNILPREQIDFLFTIRKHLMLKMLDKRFGELGVNNHFVNWKAVEKALDFQNAYFKKTQQSKKLGDILLENKDITLANKTAILLTQDRIQDHLLEQAMNDIATSEIEKMTINMRFGAIAVKKEIISIEQLNQALKIQKDDLKSGQKKYLGEIFQELFKLTENQVLQILKIQKHLEKERLALEKAVARYNSEINSNKRLNKLFELSVSKNKMVAFIHRIKDSFEKVDINHFHNWLKLNGIGFGVCSNELIQAFLSDSDTGSKLKIAKGAPPTQSKDEVIEFFFDTDFSVTARENTQNEFSPSVKKGATLARITPHILGKPGKDVLGHSVSPLVPIIFPLACGDGVVRKDLDFEANIDGNPVLYKNRSLFVNPIAQDRSEKTYTGQIKTDTMKDYDNSNLNMMGNIDEAGVVTCHHLLISGNILGKVNATGDIEVKGCIGIENKNKSECRAQLHADGNVTVSKNISNAKVVTSKGFSAPKSDAISCEIYALQDILLKNVYSSLDQPSILQIGISSNVKITSINHSIDEQTALLRKLQRQDALDELTFKLQHKINVQNEYLDKQNTLNYLLKICDDADLEHLEHLEQKIQVYVPPPQTGSNPDDNLPIPNHSDSLNYMDKILVGLKDLNSEDQRNYVNDKLTDVSKMYRAAVNTTERFSSEHKAKSDFIKRKVKKSQPEIDKIRQEIEELLVKKDFFSLNEEPPPFFEPVIKVKNMIEKNTIIKGKKSSMVVRESIFGVKMKEIKGP